MATKIYSYRIGVDGGADAKRTWNEFGDDAERNFQRASRAADTASTDLERATARQKAAMDRLEAARVITPQQRQIMDTVSSGDGGKSAKASAASLRQLLLEQDALEKKALSLRLAIDPLAGAQSKMNATVAEASMLLGKGTITQAEHTAAVKLAEKTYKDASVAIHSMGQAHAGMAGIVREGLVIVREAARGDMSRLAGSATIEAQRIGLLELALKPAGLATIAFVATIGLAIAIEERWIGTQEKINSTLLGMGAATGLTTAQINAMADAEARRGQISAATARQVELSLASTGRADPGNLATATGLVKNYSLATGQDIKAGTGDLAKVFADPAKGAEDLNNKLHFLTAAQLENIRSLEEQGNRSEALRIIFGNLGIAVEAQSKHLAGFAALGDAVGRGFSNAADNLSKFIAELMHLPSTDVTQRLRDLQIQRSALISTGPGRFPGAYRNALQDDDAQIKAAQAEQAASAARTALAQKSLRSTDLKSAFTGLDPQAEQITAVQGRIKQLRDSLTKPADLASAGLSAAQAKAAIADGEREIVQLQKRSEHIDRHAAALGRDAAAMDVNARGAMALAAAYLQGDGAALEAEARRKGATDATKKGIDTEAQTRRQLNLDIGEGAAASAKSIRAMMDETIIRQAVNEKISGGRLAVEMMMASMSDESALRPLLTLQLKAHGEQYTLLTDIIAKYRETLAQAHTEESHSNFLQSSAASDRTIAALRLQTRFAGDQTGAGAMAQALQSANAEADKNNDSPEDRVKRLGDAARVANAEQTKGQADYIAGILKADQEDLVLTQLKLSFLFKSNDAYQIALGQEKVILELRARGVDLDSDKAKSALQDRLATDLKTAAITRQLALYGELKGAGESAVDSLNRALTPEAWGKWREAGTAAANDIGAEFEKLALLNPLKNMLFGDTLPTLFSKGGGAGGGSLFGGMMSAGASWVAQALKFIPGFASGTDSAPGGLAWVGENGKELMNVPRGAQIHSASDSLAMMRTATRPAAVTVIAPAYFDARGAMTTQEFMAQANNNSARHARVAAEAAVKASRAGGPSVVAQDQLERG